MGKLINRATDLRLLISRLPCSASRTNVKLLGKPRDSTSFLKVLPGKLDIKYTHLVFTNNAFAFRTLYPLGHCLVIVLPGKLDIKYTHLVFTNNAFAFRTLYPLGHCLVIVLPGKLDIKYTHLVFTNNAFAFRTLYPLGHCLVIVLH